MDYEYKRPPEKVCAVCQYGKRRCGESCYCVLYGIIIGYSKTSCRGFEREQVREPENGNQRRSV